MTVQSASPAKKRPIILIIIAGLAGICVLCIIASFAMDAMGLLPESTPPARANTPLSTNPPLPTSTVAPTSSPAQTYFEEYGGNIDVYNQIFSLTDCAVLQEQFEIANTNNQREEAGTDAFRWTLGYMTAIDDHMRALGCYNN